MGAAGSIPAAPMVVVGRLAGLEQRRSLAANRALYFLK
jgi:hypothetical protein